MNNYPFAAFSLIFRRIFSWKTALMLGIFQNFHTLNAQPTETSEHIEFLEKYFQEFDFAGETDIQNLLENLQFFAENPIDLNQTSREQLRELLFLTDLQIENLLAYRSQLGGFESLYELQSVEGLEMEVVRMLLPFVRVGEADFPKKIVKIWQKSHTEALVRCQRPIEFPGFDRSEGNRLGLGLRVLRRVGNQFSIGFLGEKDPGEAFFRGSNPHGFDFYSAHFFMKNVSRRLKTLCVGDFSARFGQSLLFNSSFSVGKTAEAIQILRHGDALQAYQSFGESRFFRGVGSTISISKKWEATTIISRLRRDGNLKINEFPDEWQEETGFSVLQNTGLHRTPSEISDEKSVHEQVIAASLRRHFEKGALSFNAVAIDFDKPMLPSEQSFRRLDFSGKKYRAASMDYRWSRKNALFFGENALSQHGKGAFLNGALLTLDRRLTLAVLHRHFSLGYQNLYGTPFAESRTGQAERGVYFGVQILPTHRWRIDAYTDFWKYDWLKFQVSAPSAGHEQLIRFQYFVKKKATFTLRLQHEEKGRNTVLDGRQLVGQQKKIRLRQEIEWQWLPHLKTRTRAEWSMVRMENEAWQRGFLAFHEVIFHKIGAPVSASGRFAIFDTDDTDTRIFTFERDIFAAMSVPGWSGRGARTYLNLTWKFMPQWQLETRWAAIFRMIAITSTQKTGWEDEWKLLVRWRWQ